MTSEESSSFTQFQSELVAYLHNDKGWPAKLAANLESLTGFPREHFCAIAAGLLVLYLVFGYFAELICNLIGFAYPAYASMLAIESQGKADDTQWLTYWTVFAVFSLIDFGAEKICGWFPFYWAAKCIFLVYLYEPHFCGASRLYVAFVRPLIKYVHNLLTEGIQVQPQQAPAADEPATPPSP